jgi:DNA invertase Pin-like site-specific DNA recombinase
LDDGLSAWKRSTRRPGWERLLARVESGESDGIVVWHTDRLFRQPRDLEKLIALGERGVTVASAHGERNLADPDDRFILRIEVAHAARSSDDTQRRIKRRFATLREQGRPTGGPRRFGFPGLDLTWRGPEGERREVPAELVERERAALREGAAAAVAKIAMDDVAQDWNERGTLMPDGKQWIGYAARSTLLRPSLGGYVVHDGAVVGKLDGDPILDETTYTRLHALFASRRRGRPYAEKSLAVGIVRCGNCGHTLTSKSHVGTYPDGTPRRQYRCDPRSRAGCGKVSVDMAALDRELREFTIARLSDSQHAAAITAAQTQASEHVAAIRAELAEVDSVQRALSDRLGRREISIEAFDTANRSLSADHARLTAERDAAETTALIGPTQAQSAEQVTTEWDDPDTGTAERRAMLTNALGVHWLVVDRANTSKGTRRQFDRDRLRLTTPKQFVSSV